VAEGRNRNRQPRRALPRRVLMHFSVGRRLWWRGRRRGEVDFWADWLAGAPGTEQWAADRGLRLSPDTEVRDPLVRAELERLPNRAVSILDVGAGPLTILGYRYPGKTLTIEPVDPLADEYDRLLAELDLEPPIRTVAVAGEQLLERFGPGAFDLAYAANSLDHSADPLRIIQNMVAVVRTGGIVLLRHKRNEGESACYGGLHQWNFDVSGDDLVLWNNATRIDVGESLAGKARTSAWLSENEVIARLVVTARD
jgi:SAM-dependent methyltransferase